MKGAANLETAAIGSVIVAVRCFTPVLEGA